MTLAQRIKLSGSPLGKVQNLADYKKSPTYHERAQTFIKGAKAKGMTVKAEGSELIAYPKKKNVMIELKKSPKKATPKQYGDKGYKPSTGKGVGY